MLELNKIYCMDCLEGLKLLSDNSIDAIVTDPPYGLSFMNNKWDYEVPSENIWKECLRVLKPGGHLLSFGGTRTCHRMICAIEDAGFEIRDMIAWVYGSGFPKSLNIGKAIDKLQGNEREIVGKIAQPGSTNNRIAMGNGWQEEPDLTKGTSEWEGWGTALKPALEPITVARKPLSEKTVALNVLKWGTGGINIDGCRIEGDWNGNSERHNSVGGQVYGKYAQITTKQHLQGRFPANLIHDGSDEVVDLFRNSKVGARKSGQLRHTKEGDLNFTGNTYTVNDYPASEGSTSRFFYCAKASTAERNMRCDGLEKRAKPLMGEFKNNHGRETPKSSSTPRANYHPTVKPITLIKYLVKLVSQEGAVVLDSFMGSGTTAVACKELGRSFIGFEIDPDYCLIAEERLKQEVLLGTLIESREAEK